MQKFFNFVIKFCLYGIAFLISLFWLPFSFEAFEFNKQYLLIVLVSLCVFAFLARAILNKREIKIKLTPENIFILLFLFFAILSAIFSIDKVCSFFGFYGKFSDSLILLLFLVLFYFLVFFSAFEILSIFTLLEIFLFSSLLVVLTTYFSFFGIWQKIDKIFSLKIPFLVNQNFFNFQGASLEGLTIFLAIVSVLVVGLIMKERGILNILFLVGSIGILSIVNFKPAWFILAFSLFIFLIVCLAKRLFRENINSLLLPIFLIVLSLLFLFFPIDLQKVFNFQLPKEVILDYPESLKIAFGTVFSSPKNFLLGSGIGTFYHDFAKFKSPKINETSFWYLRFDKSGSFLAELLATLGILGFLSYLAFVGIFLFKSLIKIKREKITQTSREEFLFQLILFTTFLAVFLSQFIFYQNTTLAFTFWLILSLAILSQKDFKEKTISFSVSPEISLLFSTLLIILIFSIGVFFFYLGKFYLADFYFKKGIEENKIENFEKAIKLNPYQPYYKITLAQKYLKEIQNEVQNPSSSVLAPKLTKKIQKAIELSKSATKISPNQVNNWETLGRIYEVLQGIAEGALNWAISSFEKAVQLEPSNPILRTKLGRLYLISGDIKKAKENLNKAIELKKDYLLAQIEMALVLEREGKIDKAISQLEKLVKKYPYNVELLFQLGRLYFNSNQLDKAILYFQRAIFIMPNHSNSLYSLGLAYARKGEKEKALEYLERVLKLNPGNPEVLRKINELKEKP